MGRYRGNANWSDEQLKISERTQLEWEASISPRAEAELRRLEWEEAEAKAKALHDRELLEFVAAISGKPEHQWELRELERKAAEARKAEEIRQGIVQGQCVRETWDPAKHPHLGGPPNAGWWASTGGTGSAGSGAHSSSAFDSMTWRTSPTRDKPDTVRDADALGADTTPRLFLFAANDAHGAGKAAASSADSSRWYLPSDDKGTWLGKKGESTFRLKTPVDVSGKLIRDIEYRKGVPVLDKLALPGKAPTIIMTGDRDADVRHAEEAWKKLNPGEKLPKKSTFHHDLLNATDHIEMVDGKKTKIVIGKMQLVPTTANDAVSHQGTASVAKRVYEGLDPDTVAGIKRLSKEQASLAGTGKDLVARAAKKIKPGTIAKTLLPFVGRTVLRAIPLVGTGLAVLEFADNVEAHGVGGAIARATPVLGDLISAHDLGTDLAKEIRDDANAKADAHLKALNASVDQAHEEANQQTLDAFRELAPKIKVTNSPEYGSGRLVDSQEVTDALTDYRNGMIIANHLRDAGQKGFD